MGQNTVFHQIVKQRVPGTRLIGHRVADDVLESATGLRGPFASRIAYTSETSERKHWKQIYVMDVDGKNIARLT